MFDDITFYVQSLECIGTLSVSVSILTERSEDQAGGLVIIYSEI